MRGRWRPSIARALSRAAASDRLRVALLTLYYLGVLAGLVYLYGRGDFRTPPFVYQGF
jgi:hypothetical protein